MTRKTSWLPSSMTSPTSTVARGRSGPVDAHPEAADVFELDPVGPAGAGRELLARDVRAGEGVLGVVRSGAGAGEDEAARGVAGRGAAAEDADEAGVAGEEGELTDAPGFVGAPGEGETGDEGGGRGGGRVRLSSGRVCVEFIGGGRGGGEGGEREGERSERGVRGCVRSLARDWGLVDSGRANARASARGRGGAARGGSRFCRRSWGARSLRSGGRSGPVETARAVRSAREGPAPAEGSKASPVIRRRSEKDHA